MISKFPVIIYDTASIALAWYFSFWLRFNMQPLPAQLISREAVLAFAILVPLQLTAYFYFKVYRGLWRYSSLPDVIRIIKAAVVATLGLIPILHFQSLLNFIPRSIFPLYSIILVTLLCAGRLVYRMLKDLKNRPNYGVTQTKKILIIGAGQAAEGLVRELNRMHIYYPVGLIDDDNKKKGLEVHGIQVIGKVKDLPAITKLKSIDLIFIAIPSAKSAEMRKIVDICEACGIPFRTLPGIQQLAAGRVQVNSLRKVHIEDLLGRDQVILSWERINSYIHGKTILVTGGGGSIGSELCRQIMELKPKKLIILDNNEFNLYSIEQEIRNKYPSVDIIPALISVTDVIALEHMFTLHAPQIVFHAAAYKHVPMLEEQIRVAVKNNTLGTKYVAEASHKAGVEKFILISTDKAVNPTNIMGTTKRTAEIFCQNLNQHSQTQFITVRFGNVLGSVGSVVPLFKKQLEKGGPLTVTHPDIQRYFMTIPEASQLILQAMVNGEGGEIFVLDMGEPIKISYLAEQMIILAGKEPGVDIQIEYTGLRPGEKLYEELFHHSEQLSKTEHEKLFKAQFRELDWQELQQTFLLINRACAQNDDKELLILLKNLVPEFHSEKFLEKPLSLDSAS
jgi:FlaA1/EpsC-like NDP-sugar epimerase